MGARKRTLETDGVWVRSVGLTSRVESVWRVLVKVDLERRRARQPSEEEEGERKRSDEREGDRLPDAPLEQLHDAPLRSPTALLCLITNASSERGLHLVRADCDGREGRSRRLRTAYTLSYACASAQRDARASYQTVPTRRTSRTRPLSPPRPRKDDLAARVSAHLVALAPDGLADAQKGREHHDEDAKGGASPGGEALRRELAARAREAEEARCGCARGTSEGQGRGASAGCSRARRGEEGEVDARKR